MQKKKNYRINMKKIWTLKMWGPATISITLPYKTLITI